MLKSGMHGVGLPGVLHHRRCHWGGHPPPNTPLTPCNVCGGVLQGGDGSAAWGEWLEQEAKAPISALPCVTLK